MIIKVKKETSMSFDRVDIKLISDAYYGVTSFYDDPKDVITEMAENYHGTVIDFYYQS